MKRLADVEVPRLWPLSLLGALLLVRRADRRELRRLESVASELGTFYGERYKKQDDREDQLLRLTRGLARLTVALLVLTAATLGVAVLALLRG